MGKEGRSSPTGQKGDLAEGGGLVLSTMFFVKQKRARNMIRERTARDTRGSGSGVAYKSRDGKKKLTNPKADKEGFAGSRRTRERRIVLLQRKKDFGPTRFGGLIFPQHVGEDIASEILGGGKNC